MKANSSDTYKNRTPRVIAVSSQKGGVGKSTTAINVAAYLGEYGYRTILVDMDPQSNSTSGIGIDYKRLDTSIYDILIHNENPNNVIMETPYKNLMILPSNNSLLDAEIGLTVLNGRELRLKNALEKIEYDFDFIIIDCSSSLGPLTTNALVSANEIIIPMQCEFYAMEGVYRLIEAINNIKYSLNNLLEITGIVFTMYLRTVLSRQVIKKVKKHLPGRVFNTIIPKNVRLVEAPSMGKPIKTYDPFCKGAQAYKNLTREIIEAGSKADKKEIFTFPRKFLDFWDTGASPRHAVKRH